MIQLQSERFINSYYHKLGEGFPIVLLHGFAEDDRIWDKQISVFQRLYQVIIPNIPGTRKSALPIEKMSMELIADFINEILIQEKIETCILFGHSMGGYAAMAFLEKYAYKLAGLGLVHSSVYSDTEEKKETRRKGIKILQEGGKVQFLKALIPNIVSPHSKDKCEQEIEYHLTSALEISPESLIAYYEAMLNRPDRSHLLLNTDLPVFIFAGKDDVAVPVQTSLQQSYLAKHTYFELINRVGHMGMYEAVDLLNESAIKYVNTVLSKTT